MPLTSQSREVSNGMSAIQVRLRVVGLDPLGLTTNDGIQEIELRAAEIFSVGTWIRPVLNDNSSWIEGYKNRYPISNGVRTSKSNRRQNWIKRSQRRGSPNCEIVSRKGKSIYYNVLCGFQFANNGRKTFFCAKRFFCIWYIIFNRFIK